MNNIVKPIPCEILSVNRESLHEYTYRVKTDIKPEHGQFLQLSIPKIGEAPISVSSFRKEAGDTLFLRGAYGKGWPTDQFKGKNVVVITGGTGLAPVKSMLNMFCDQPDFVKSVTLISGFKNEEGIIFKNDLDRWAKHFNTIYTLDKDQKEGWRVGFVSEFISEIPFDQFGEDYEVVIVGPPPMMKFTGLAVVKNGAAEEKIWMSFERKMSCAVGKCGHCRIDETYVCLDGPVFNYTKAKYLVD